MNESSTTAFTYQSLTYGTTKMAENATLPVQPRWTEHTLFTLLALNGIESLTRAMGHLDKFNKSLTTHSHTNYIKIKYFTDNFKI